MKDTVMIFLCLTVGMVVGYLKAYRPLWADVVLYWLIGVALFSTIMLFMAITSRLGA